MFALETSGLRNARLIKNVRLNSVVEIFSGEETGSGQIEVDDIGTAFGWRRGMLHPDFSVLQKLARLPSYDVYSLRILLHKDGIGLADSSQLDVSDRKKNQLDDYLHQFTDPLIANIYGGADSEVAGLDDVMKIFRNPDVSKTRARLGEIADKLGIGIAEVPGFFESYGEVFLSICYYRQCLDQIKPAIIDFFETIGEIRVDWKLRHDHQLLKVCDQLETTVGNLAKLLNGRFEMVDTTTNKMWDEFSAERFRDVENMIQNNHVIMGGVLCALSVKMDAWSKRFPDRDAGGPIRRADYIVSDMRQGFETLGELRRRALPSDNIPL